MKTFPGFLAGAWLVLSGVAAAMAASADDFHTPGPPYPEEARQANVAGAGLCGVVFGASGSVAKAAMLKSTGSDVLDRNTLDWARAHWTGKPNTRVKVPIAYRLSPARPPAAGAFHLPTPPYSHLALTHNESGVGQYQVVFGQDGHAARVVTVKSSGSGFLDARTLEWATQCWIGPAGAQLVVTIDYTIR